MDFEWEDIALSGALAEEMTEAEKERMRIEMETEPHDPPDEEEEIPGDADIDDLIP